MSHHWLLITFSCFVPASLQYFGTGGPLPAEQQDPLGTGVPQPYLTQFSSMNDFEVPEGFYDPDPNTLRKRRMTDETTDSRWLANLVDTSRPLSEKNDEQIPLEVEYAGLIDDDESQAAIHAVKRTPRFCLWCGKRTDTTPIEQMWLMRRAAAIGEPDMQTSPFSQWKGKRKALFGAWTGKRSALFRPWTGKRKSLFESHRGKRTSLFETYRGKKTGQMVYKPGGKASKVIFSTSIPELTRIFSNFSPNGERFNLARFQVVPTKDKRNPFKVMSLSANMDGKTMRDALPFKEFMESLPMFKVGHPYSEVDLKKDGKRKVKFSVWGGKRAPPIIGPIWTPAAESAKEPSLDTILMIRNNPDEDNAKP